MHNSVGYWENEGKGLVSYLYKENSMSSESDLFKLSHFSGPSQSPRVSLFTVNNVFLSCLHEVVPFKSKIFLKDKYESVLDKENA